MLTSEKKKKPYLVLLKPKMSNSFPPQNKLSSLELSVTYKICFFFSCILSAHQRKEFLCMSRLCRTRFTLPCFAGCWPCSSHDRKRSMSSSTEMKARGVKGEKTTLLYHYCWTTVTLRFAEDLPETGNRGQMDKGRMIPFSSDLNSDLTTTWLPIYLWDPTGHHEVCSMLGRHLSLVTSLSLQAISKADLPVSKVNYVWVHTLHQYRHI